MSIRPSPALVVSADLSIGDCVRKMRDRDVGSVLIVRGTAPHDLVGIFTERDLVHRIDEIQHGGYWEKSISTVMSHPVITLSIYELAKAPEMMTRCRIRHLPVVYEDDAEKQHLAGVISMRDLFEDLVRDEAKVEEEVKIAILSRDPTSQGVLKTLFSQHGKAQVDELTLDPKIEEAAALQNLIQDLRADHASVFVLDLDFIGPSQWARLLQLLNHEDHAPRTIILFTPEFHESKNIAILDQLKKGGKITAFAKPINILEVLQKAQLPVR